MNRDTLREKLPVIITTIVFLGMYVAGGLHNSAMFKPQVFLNLFSDNAFLGVVAVGVTFVILTGGIDLSVGSMVGCSSIMAASLISHSHLHPAVAMLITLLFGVLVGLGHGILIAKFDLPPFLATLAGLFFCRGVGLMISQESMKIDHPFFDKISNFSISLTDKISITGVAIIFVVVVILGAFLAKQTPFGRTIYAIGGNKSSASMMGLPVTRTLILAYTLCGLCAAFGGLVNAMYTQSGNATTGVGLELDAIASVVIGGTLLSGGYGSMFGTLIGVLILGVVQTVINFDGTLSSWWTKIVIGALLLTFMLIQKIIETAASRRSRSAAA